jgi:hypothetical protein
MDRPQYCEADIQAIRAFARGIASADQQIRAFEYIINYACQTYDQCWRADQRMTDLALGQALPGQHLVFMVKEAPTTTDEAIISIEARSKDNENS